MPTFGASQQAANVGCRPTTGALDQHMSNGQSPIATIHYKKLLCGIIAI